MFSINERFRIIYKESGLSQEKFADKIKRSRGEVANIIYDKTIPKDKIIEATCEAFDIQEDWLKHGLEPMRAAKSREDEIAELVGSALSGSSDFKKAVIRMICSRSDEELKALEAALLAVYEGIKKDQGI
jgi:transcriptional regulator with XRE-family HTH domain